MMKTILILGATGFVGSHTLAYLARYPDIRLIAACRDASRLPAGIAVETRCGDVNDASYRETLFDGVDVVCNAFAWSSLFGHARQSEQRFLQPSLALIDAAIAAGVRHYVNISSTSAAAPDTSLDASSPGIPRRYWPHLCSVIRIEDYLRDKAAAQFSVVNLRLGLFAGERYSLGLLPILLPRLKTHLVPWVAGGRTQMPIIDGRDIGQAMAKAAMLETMQRGFESINVVGASIPSVREVLTYLGERGYPTPHFSVPFPVAFAFAGLMELLNPMVTWEPLVTRSIIHLLRNTDATNNKASKVLGYQPEWQWQDAVDAQLAEMQIRQKRAMRMAKEY